MVKKNKRNLRVLHLSSAQSWRGGENQIYLLIKGLQKLGIHNYVAAPISSPLLTTIRKFSIPQFPYRKLFSWNPIISLRLMNYVKGHNIDLLHIHDSHAHNYALTACAYGMDIPLVLSRKVDFAPTSVKKYRHPNIKKIICVSDAVRKVLQSRIGHSDKMVVVHDGIDEKTSPTLSLHQHLQLTSRTKLIINISALADHKDHYTFVLAADQYLKNYNQEVKFVIIGGDAGTEKATRSLINKIGRENQILLTGHLDNARAYLPSASTFLFTSKEEGLGSSLLDAMLYEVPIITTNAGGIPEIVIHNKNGLVSSIRDYISLAENLHIVLSEPGTRKKLIQNGKIQAEKRSFNNFARETLEHYLEIV